MFVLGMAIFMAGVALAALMCSQFSTTGILMLIDLPTALIYIIAMLSVIVGTGSVKSFMSAINAVLSKSYYISAADKEKAIRLFRLLGRTSIYASVVITMIGLISILAFLDDVQYIGPNIAVAILSMLYGFGVNLIFIYPAIHVLESRYNAEEKRVISEKEVIDKLLELCYRQGVSAEEILDAKEITFRKQ